MNPDQTSRADDSLIDLDALSPVHQRWIFESGPEIHEHLVALLHELGEQVKGDKTWWLCSVSSRDPYLSPLYERCCRIALVEHLVEKSSQPLTVATSDRALAKSFRKWNRSRDIHPVRVLFRRSKVPAMIRKWIPELRNLAAMAWELVTRFLSRDPAAFRGRASKVKVLLQTFVSGDADESLTFFGPTDHYYPNLEKALSEGQRGDLGVLPTLLGGRNFRRLNQTCRRADPRCLIVDDALQLSDYLHVAFVLPWRLLMLSCRVSGSFSSVDIRDCLKWEIRGRLWHHSIILAHLQLRFFARAADMGLKLRTMISWSENQLVDKAASLGVSLYLPETSLVAYKSYPIGARYLPHLITTPDERLAKTTPAEITLIGEAFAATARGFDEELKINIGPALRFNTAHKSVTAGTERSSSTEGLEVLLVLPIPPSEIDYMIDFVTKASELLPDGAAAVSWRLKPHPKASATLVDGYAHLLEQLPKVATATVVNGGMAEALHGMDVLVSNTSSACLEALVGGVQVAVVPNPNGLVFNPIPDELAEGCWKVCFNPNDLIEVLDGSRDSLSGDDFPGRESVFAKSDPDSILRLLRMDGGTKENW